MRQIINWENTTETRRSRRTAESKCRKFFLRALRVSVVNSASVPLPGLLVRERPVRWGFPAYSSCTTRPGVA